MRGIRNLKYTCLSIVMKRLMKEKGTNLIALHYDTGIPYTTLYDWSNGVIPSNPDELMKLRDCFKVSTDYLLYGTDGDRETLQKQLKEKEEELEKANNKLEFAQCQLSFMDEIAKNQRLEIANLKKEKEEK